MISKKVFAVIKREYITRFKTKGFIIGTLIFPVILVLIFGGIFIFGSIFQPSTQDIAVIDMSGKIFDKFVKLQTDTLKSGIQKYNFHKVKVYPETLDTVLAGLKHDLIVKKSIDCILVIPEDIMESKKVKYLARTVSNFEQQQSFGSSFSRIVTNSIFENMGVKPEEIRKAFAMGRVSVNTRQVTEKGVVEKSGVSGFALTYILTYVMLLLMMTYGQSVMRSVIEEKSQRITETIVSSIRPIELLIGKITGVCGLGLTQLTIFGIFLLGGIALAEPLFTKFGVQSPEVFELLKQIHFTPSLFGYMLLFFTLGYVFFSLIFAAVGAMVTSEEEGQQFQMPIIFLIMIGYFIMFTVAKNPETSQAFWASLIPIFTPMVMFARIAVSDPILPSGTFLSLGIMIVSIVLLTMAIAKIYRVGILMYGKKASLKEALKWLRYK
ncbi:ABC transporter permease [bacterium]|nr:ABC transporter permease [bacterium]